MSSTFDSLARLASSVSQQIATRSASGSPRDFLTNPTNGIQTMAGKSLAAIIQTYGDIKASGQNSPAVIAATIAAIETVRSAFEAKVRSLGPDFWTLAGAGGVATINSVAARLTNDRRAELAQLTGADPMAAAAAGAPGANATADQAGIALFFILVIGFIAIWYVGTK